MRSKPRTYNPDKWTIIGDGENFKVFGNWSGGYLDGDSWRLSSGLERIETDPENENYYLMHNYSGSIYRCHKNMMGMNGYGSAIYAGWKEHDKEGKLKTWTVEEFNEATSGNTNNQE